MLQEFWVPLKPASPEMQPISVMLNLNDTLDELKLKIYEQAPNLNPDSYILIYRGKTMEPHFTMKSFYIEPGNTIDMASFKFIIFN